jgi:NADH:ubiquinone oxidoreductase subunit
LVFDALADLIFFVGRGLVDEDAERRWIFLVNLSLPNAIPPDGVWRSASGC